MEKVIGGLMQTMMDFDSKFEIPYILVTAKQRVPLKLIVRTIVNSKEMTNGISTQPRRKCH